ncbi:MULTISPECIES: hypothetical protein [Pseudoalteromonas]|uniref:Uncharacterized protein n=1 Tax=Pseudoalteromonas luteoviolacea (strain 2ta16) TaxID=1353533 RepID=V4HYT9_PSEL2|nr:MULTISPECIES: hypothetical protein [Pseudoalteromonas]ESP93114.1 hypothetical protein PL2TA16_03335 [Pseudoalteromonas luteoviolacea 2ta16]KZN36985.1 hypothetical protein N483_21305 [Pseudoalteromonas luteoviolacea NCIMB 1944]MCG7549914.1 hypothetical protein [Pseudoalteromonas sp. Of7M-16]
MNREERQFSYENITIEKDKVVVMNGQKSKYGYSAIIKQGCIESLAYTVCSGVITYTPTKDKIFTLLHHTDGKPSESDCTFYVEWLKNIVKIAKEENQPIYAWFVGGKTRTNNPPMWLYNSLVKSGFKKCNIQKEYLGERNGSTDIKLSSDGVNIITRRSGKTIENSNLKWNDLINLIDQK